MNIQYQSVDAIDHSSDPVNSRSETAYRQRLVQCSIFQRKSPLEQEKENQLADFAEGCTEVDAPFQADSTRLLRMIHLWVQEIERTYSPFTSLYHSTNDLSPLSME